MMSSFSGGADVLIFLPRDLRIGGIRSSGQSSSLSNEKPPLTHL